MVALALVLPFLIHAVWSYIETSRFDIHVRAIEAKGEPTQLRSATPTGDTARAERYYRAAAVLASEFRPEPAGGWYEQIAVAERTGQWPDDLIARARELLTSYQEMFAFVDRAADLPFEDFPAGTTYNYLAAGLIDAIRLTSLRAIIRAADGDADGAARSLYAAVRAGRWFSRKHPSFTPYSIWFISAVVGVFERGRPGETALEPLARSLEEADRDDVLEQWLLTMRAGDLQSEVADPWFIGSRRAPVFAIERPWRTHQFNRQLSWYAEALEAAETPWPKRIEAIVDGDVEYFNLDVPFDRKRMSQMITAIVAPLAAIRSVRVAIGIERYRRRQSEQLPPTLGELVPSILSAAPVDPFTGEAVRYIRTDNGYAVYSVGENRTDDGGDIRVPWARGADVGVRVGRPK